jgi:hypothetical protein
MTIAATTKEKVTMRIPVLLITITLFVFSYIGCNKTRTSSAEMIVAPTPVAVPNVTAQAATKFSSEYTTLTKCGSGMTKKEEKEAEKNGSDIPTRCNGPGSYDIYIYYSACASHFTAVKGEESISLAMQAVNWKQKTVEWRMANGKPFAVIMRDYEYKGNDLCTTDGTITGESLIVKGLKGYDHIDETVNVKTTPDPNVKARELADKGYR